MERQESSNAEKLKVSGSTSASAVVIGALADEVSSIVAPREGARRNTRGACGPRGHWNEDPTTKLTDALFGEDFVEGFDGAVGEADVGAVGMDTDFFDQPWLRRPAVGNAGFGGEHGGYVMNPGTFVFWHALRGHLRNASRALPCFRRDTVFFQGTQPESFPRLGFDRRWALRPNVLMILQVAVQPDINTPHVGHAGRFARAVDKIAEVWKEKEQ